MTLSLGSVVLGDGRRNQAFPQPNSPSVVDESLATSKSDGGQTSPNRRRCAASRERRGSPAECWTYGLTLLPAQRTKHQLLAVDAQRNGRNKRVMITMNNGLVVGFPIAVLPGLKRAIARANASKANGRLGGRPRKHKGIEPLS
jgi:hypothetical protein